MAESGAERPRLVALEEALRGLLAEDSQGLQHRSAGVPLVIHASRDAADWLAAAMAGEQGQVGVKVMKTAKAGTA